ncbi:MAG TPA: hypothetical protein VM674_07315 [Candidatus Acidoferrum sp.]|nr:hypothetical protein [Candidatus Acidoferrum sp.]
MKDAVRKPASNVVPLRLPKRTAAQERAARTADKVRRQLSLLQGYADLMEGLSPDQNIKILTVMAEKIHELTVALDPFLQDSKVEVPALDDYRRARERTRQLLSDYRLLLDRLHATVKDAQGGAPSA